MLKKKNVKIKYKIIFKRRKRSGVWQLTSSTTPVPSRWSASWCCTSRPSPPAARECSSPRPDPCWANSSPASADRWRTPARCRTARWSATRATRCSAAQSRSPTARDALPSSPAARSCARCCVSRGSRGRRRPTTPFVPREARPWRGWRCPASGRACAPLELPGWSRGSRRWSLPCQCRTTRSTATAAASRACVLSDPPWSFPLPPLIPVVDGFAAAAAPPPPPPLMDYFRCCWSIYARRRRPPPLLPIVCDRQLPHRQGALLPCCCPPAWCFSRLCRHRLWRRCSLRRAYDYCCGTHISTPNIFSQASRDFDILQWHDAVTPRLTLVKLFGIDCGSLFFVFCFCFYVRWKYIYIYEFQNLCRIILRLFSYLLEYVISIIVFVKILRWFCCFLFLGNPQSVY